MQHISSCLPACTAFTFEFGALWPEHLWWLEGGIWTPVRLPPTQSNPVNAPPTTAHLQALEPPQHTRTQGIMIQQCSRCLGLRALFAHHSMCALHEGWARISTRLHRPPCKHAPSVSSWNTTGHICRLEKS